MLRAHDLGTLSNNCDRAIWMDQGLVAFDGPVEDTLDKYLTETS